MKLTFDFSALWRVADQIGAKHSNFSLDDEIKPLDPIDVRLSGEGIDVDPEALKLRGGLFSYEGRQVVLYIPDHTNKDIEKALTTQGVRKKFHVTYCEHLNNMKQRGYFERYKATNKLTGKFHIFGKSKLDRTMKEGDVALDVCMFCLQKLNYKGSADKFTRRKVRDSFVIPEFFSTYSSFFPYLPSGIGGDPDKADYTSDWSQVSSAYRQTKNYTCEVCNVTLNDQKHLLHTHHINAVRGDNRQENLQALCVDCHRKEHGHMYVSHSDMQTITMLRNQQSVIQRNWESVLQYADPALRGILEKLQIQNYSAPVLGYFIEKNDNDSCLVDAAWPEQRMAVAINMPQTIPSGWELFAPEAFL